MTDNTKVPLGLNFSIGIEGTPFKIETGIYAKGDISVMMSVNLTETDKTGVIVNDIGGSLSLSANASISAELEALIGDVEGDQRGFSLVGEAKLTGVEAIVTTNDINDSLDFQIILGALSVEAHCELRWGTFDWELFKFEIPIYEEKSYPDEPIPFWQLPGSEIWDLPIAI